MLRNECTEYSFVCHKRRNKAAQGEANPETDLDRFRAAATHFTPSMGLKVRKCFEPTEKSSFSVTIRKIRFLNARNFLKHHQNRKPASIQATQSFSRFSKSLRVSKNASEARPNVISIQAFHRRTTNVDGCFLNVYQAACINVKMSQRGAVVTFALAHTRLLLLCSSSKTERRWIRLNSCWLVHLVVNPAPLLRVISSLGVRVAELGRHGPYEDMPLLVRMPTNPDRASLTRRFSPPQGDSSTTLWDAL
ncbi:hypothetical protein T265_06885 [Opisthorchis viverrini]|uniref:Uncharacterized protein n=1 Tax=Opisthorchis viverrini TaxID=6198 RepID=A0A074ZQV3_OPIVI|nr:hypothetical protein T265_06885 [Opisthorchis viverrini]KER25710.1 hypothetical protein T265_06885 [Opisthorchis viverrini]